MIRPAKYTDFEMLVRLGERFHAMSEQPTPYDPKAFENMCSNMILMDNATVFVSGAGMIGGVIYPSWAAPVWNLAVELFWYAEDGSGRDLLTAFEEWAAEHGAHELRMTTLAAKPGAGRILERRGYEVSEVSYARVI